MSPTASAKKMWFSAAENETKSSELGPKNKAKHVPIFPPFALPLVVLDIFPPKNWFVFSSALRLGSEGGATENS